MRLSPALLLAVYSTWAWSGCATAPRPLVDSGYAARAYTPGRIAVLPPDVFVVLDQVGDNDPVKSAALGQVVGAETARAIDGSLRARGYDVDMLGRWDGVYGPDGAPIPGGEALEGLARGIIAFASSTDGARQGPTALPPRVAPQLAAAVGSAAQADALLYVNVKGVVTTPGRQTATVLTAVFLVVIVAAIVLAVASQKGGGGGGHGLGGGGVHAPRPAPAAGAWKAAPVGSAMRQPVRPAVFHSSARSVPTVRPASVAAVRPGPAATVRPASVAAVRPAPPVARPAPVGAWRGGARPVGVRGGPVYVGGFGNLNLVVPLDEPVYTHDGSVDYDDPWFAGDELYVSMTLVSTVDGRVLWHARDSLDLEANHPDHIDRMVQAFMNTIPPALPPPPPMPPPPMQAPPMPPPAMPPPAPPTAATP